MYLQINHTWVTIQYLQFHETFILKKVIDFNGRDTDLINIASKMSQYNWNASASLLKLEKEAMVQSTYMM